MSDLEKSRVVINEQGKACDGYGIMYETMSKRDMDMFCEKMERGFDKSSRDLSMIYEKEVPKEKVHIPTFGLAVFNENKPLCESLGINTKS